MRQMLRTVSGVPPLTIRATRQHTIKEITFYGNEAGNVGIITANLFDKSAIINNSRIGISGQLVLNDTVVLFASDYIEVDPRTIYSTNNAIGGQWDIRACEYDENKNYIRTLTDTAVNTFTTGNTTRYIRFTHSKSVLNDLMLTCGTLPDEYEPFGYKIVMNIDGEAETRQLMIYTPFPLMTPNDYLTVYPDIKKAILNSSGQSADISDMQIWDQLFLLYPGANIIFFTDAISPGKVNIRHQSS
ncbi:MAG: hypothetical protein J1G06_01175 [Oscillospiraceae bacterium]|nr:hypothetical protein [Oscillospiraceae bacterium]